MGRGHVLIFGLAALAAPRAAVSQPGAMPAPAPGPVAAPMPGPAAAPMPAPAPGPVAAPMPAPAPGPVAAPIPAPAPGPVAAPMPAPAVAPLQPLVAQPTSTSPTSPLGHGVTFEANIGFGRLRLAADSGETATEAALGGLDLGIGGWISSRAAATVRIAGVTYSEGGTQITNAFFGASVQYWLTDSFWLGAGAGLGLMSLTLDAGDPDTRSGLGLDFRVGARVLGSGHHTMNVSLEVNPTYLDRGTATGFALLLGYQYL
jgi:hypothetical protein